MILSDFIFDLFWFLVFIWYSCRCFYLFLRFQCFQLLLLTDTANMKFVDFPFRKIIDTIRACFSLSSYMRFLFSYARNVSSRLIPLPVR